MRRNPATVMWRTAVAELAAIRRPSASEGERIAAERIAGWLHDLGCEVQIEPEPAHGGYWWPIALANAIAAGAVAAAFGGRRRRRASLAGAAVCSLSAAALWDDLGHGSRWFRRALLPQRTTWNVVGQTGDPASRRTLVVIAHHDAAHSGLVFHPALGRIGPRWFPRLHERSQQTLPILYLVWLGPALGSLGALLGARRLARLSLLFSLGTIAAMLDIAMRDVVPGANDNLSAVAVLLAVAEALRREPLEGARVLLLSTGSEESFSEGMQAFARRHFDHLDRSETEFLCLECLGGPILVVLEGEGMLRMRAYPHEARQRLADAAGDAGVAVTRGLRTVAATDAIIPLRAGYPVATLASVEDTKLPLNYHWPSDRPEALHEDTIEQAIATCLSFLRSRARAVGSD